MTSPVTPVPRVGKVHRPGAYCGFLCVVSREGDVAGEGLAQALPPLHQVQQDAVGGVPRRGEETSPFCSRTPN